MQQKLKLAFSLLSRDVESEQDQCLERLIELLRTRKGIEECTWIAATPHRGCACTTTPILSRCRWWAGGRSSPARDHDRYCHETLRLTGMDCGDCAASIEYLLAGSRASWRSRSVTPATDAD